MNRNKLLHWSTASALYPHPYRFSFFRYIEGVASGASSVIAPTYFSQILTTHGSVLAMYLFNIVFGILAAFVANFFLHDVDVPADWQWLFALITLSSIIYVPPAPRVPKGYWPAKRRQPPTQKIALTLSGVPDAKVEID